MKVTAPLGPISQSYGPICLTSRNLWQPDCQVVRRLCDHIEKWSKNTLGWNSAVGSACGKRRRQARIEIWKWVLTLAADPGVRRLCSCRWNLRARVCAWALLSLSATRCSTMETWGSGAAAAAEELCCAPLPPGADPVAHLIRSHGSRPRGVAPAVRLPVRFSGGELGLCGH